MRFKKSFLPLMLALGLCLQVVSAASISKTLAPAAERLDYRFFYWLFDKEDLQKAYVLAQEEDFEPGGIELFSDSMKALMKVPEKNWEDKLGNLEEFWYLEEELKTLKPAVANELISEWRYIYLQKMMEFMRLEASRQPVFKFLLSSTTSHDSNINRVDENDPAGGTPTGKDDGQQMFLLNMKWMPLANDKKFSKENDFSQSLNVIRIHQFKNKKNQVMIFDTESKWTRKKVNENVKNISVAYRLQNFGLSGDDTTRDTHSLFYTHRLKVDASFVPHELSGDLKSTWTDLSLSWIEKQQLNEAAEQAGKDAKDIRFKVTQSLMYVANGKKGTAKASLEYVDYSTDSDRGGNYDYIAFKLNNKNSFVVNSFKDKLRISEEFGWRMKAWDDKDAAGLDDEDFLWLQVKGSTKLTPSLDASLSLRHAWRDRTIDDGTGTFEGRDADQTIIAFGLNWSAP